LSTSRRLVADSITRISIVVALSIAPFLLSSLKALALLFAIEMVSAQLLSRDSARLWARLCLPFIAFYAASSAAIGILVSGYVGSSIAIMCARIACLTATAMVCRAIVDLDHVMTLLSRFTTLAPCIAIALSIARDTPSIDEVRKVLESNYGERISIKRIAMVLSFIIVEESIDRVESLCTLVPETCIE